MCDTFVGYAVSYVYVKDINNNHLSQSTVMYPPFSVDIPAVTQAFCPNLTGTGQITINSGALPDSVWWLDYYTGNPVVVGNPAILPVGEYQALAYYNGCSELSIDSGIFIYHHSSITFSQSTTTAGCANGTASITNITGGIAPYTFLWTTGANTSSINNLTGGNYCVIVTDSQGCYTTGCIYVTQTPSINVNSTVTPATCLQNDGSIISFGSGGVPPYTYLYSNGMAVQNITGLSGGSNINVQVTDANGCKGFAYVYVDMSTPITVSYTSAPSSCTAPTGSATLSVNGGTLPYTYYWNTYPPQTGVSISNMPAGSYNFKVTDATGCIRTGTVVIPSQSIINATIYSVNAVCPGTTGSVGVNVSGNNGPFTYQWNNGSTSAMLSNAPAGYYSCTITDNAGCSIIKNKQISIVSSIGNGFITNPASCMYENDGSIIASSYGGTPPYTYHWSNGQTGNMITGLASGHYFVGVSDAAGCTYTGYNTHTFVGFDPNNDSCYCTIKGKVFVDTNGNCLYDSGEQGVAHIMIHCSGFGYAFTDNNGDYSFKVPSGSYTLSETVQYIYPLALCQSNSIPVTAVAQHACNINIDFANIIVPLHDIHIATTSNSGPPIPGFTYTQGLIIQNDGTVSEPDIQLGYRHDGQLQLVNVLPNLFIQQSPVLDPNWYSINSGFPVLLPGEAIMLNVNYNVPTNLPLNTSITYKDTAVSALPMSTWLSDYSPWNNINSYQTSVVGSYDPNYKEVIPKGEGAAGLISTADSVLDYIIHFQNVGSYFAENIVITDTLDAYLNWMNLRPGYATHDYTATMDESGVLQFRFDNIHLDYKAHCEPNSKGLVSFSINQNPNLNAGTEIQNKANIFFDFNSPVTTNTTLNTISTTVATYPKCCVDEVLIYPNPARDILNIKSKSMKAVKIYDISGRLLIYEKTLSETENKISTQMLAHGIYLIELIKQNGVKVYAKFVKN